MTGDFDTDHDVMMVSASLKQPATLAEVAAMHFGERAGGFFSRGVYSDEIARALEARASGDWQRGCIQQRFYLYIVIDQPHSNCARCAAAQKLQAEWMREAELSA